MSWPIAHSLGGVLCALNMVMQSRSLSPRSLSLSPIPRTATSLPLGSRSSNREESKAQRSLNTQTQARRENSPEAVFASGGSSLLVHILWVIYPLCLYLYTIVYSASSPTVVRPLPLRGKEGRMPIYYRLYRFFSSFAYCSIPG